MTITHPQHPLCGQQVAVVRSRRGTDPDLIVRLPNGLHAAVAMSWTDYAALPALDPPSGPVPLLDVNGLRQAVHLITRLRQEGRCPATEAPDTADQPSAAPGG